MSYEAEMFAKMRMPSREEVEEQLLSALFKNGGVVKEFAKGDEVVTQIADFFMLNSEQRSFELQTVYRKENRIKKSNLWNRLLYRAAHSLSKQSFVSLPSQTFKITGQKEWMLTENGFDEALKLRGIPESEKEVLPIKSFEVERHSQRLISKRKPANYKPFSIHEASVKPSLQSVRIRSFRRAVMQAYNCTCAVCGLKLREPDSEIWEAEAAHIIPHSAKGKDDVWNGLSLCRLHHWTFDVGWFSVANNRKIIVSQKIADMPDESAQMFGNSVLKQLKEKEITLPLNPNLWPDESALEWHRNHVLK